MSIAFWLCGFVGLVIAAVVASARARAMPGDVVARGAAFAAAVTCAGLAAGAIWLWGGAMATNGRADRLRDGALVRLSVREIAVPIASPTNVGRAAVPEGVRSSIASPTNVGRAAVPEGVRSSIDKTIAVGHADAASVRLPGTGPAEIVRVEVAGANVQVSTSAPEVWVMPAELAGTLATVATARCKSGEGDRRAYALPPGAAVVVIECDGKRPATALTLRRDRVRAEVTATVHTWRGHFVLPQLTVRAGDVLRIGSADDAVPGVTGWDVPAEHGTSTIVVVPSDPTDCGAWNAPTLVSKSAPTDPVARTPRDRATGHGANACELDAGVFALSAVTLIPDADGVVDRNARAVIAIVTPIVMLLFALALAPPSLRRSRVIARGLRLAVLGVGLAALVCWRLAWAHRIDMLRDLVPAGTRVADNVFAAVAIGAALAGLAVDTLDAVHTAATWRRIASALGAWAIGFIAGIIVAGVPALSSLRLGVIGMSIVTAVLPILRGKQVAPEWKLAAIAIAAIAARALAPHLVFAKLGLAYFLVFAGHAALCVALAADTRLLRRAVVLALLAIAALALARFDAGVTLAIAGVGLALAMMVAGHDTMYHAAHAGKLGVLEREHARLLAVHGIAAIAIVVIAGVFALIADDRDLIESSTDAALYAPLVAAAMFGLAAAVARSNRRAWVPWLAAALAAFALWGARDSMIEWATGGSGVASQRVSAVVEPGYAVLRDERKFAANVSAWREAALPAANDDSDRWSGQGYFGARVTDPGVLHSVANDYFPVLVARESGVAGLVQGVLLVLGLVVAAAATAGARLRHASDEHRGRWLVASVVGALCVYQPLASLGVLPLTGISWPGMGIDSPSDLWFLVIGLAWAMMGADRPSEAPDANKDRSGLTPAPKTERAGFTPACGPKTERAGFTPACGIDERVRTAPRLRRARKIVVGGLAIAGVAAVIVVARVGSAALGRAGTATASQHIHDARVDTALRYAQGLACPWPDKTGTIDEVVPVAFGGTPTDPATARFDRELRTAWLTQRTALVTALPTCKGKLANGQLASANGTCTASFSIGWPELRLDVSRTASGAYHASCAVALPGDTLAMLRDRPAAIKIPRIRVVGEAMGVAARDVGELVAGTSIVRLRPGAAEATLPTDGFTTAAKVTVATGTTLTVDGARVMLHGPAQLLVADGAAWRRVARAGDVALDRMTLVVAGSRIVLFRPPRAWNGIASVDPLLADDVAAAGERVRRAYPYGAAIPELGWVNPFAVDHSLGLDGWIHAAQTQPASAAASCGTLAPPSVPRDRVCAPSPLDGVMECRVTVQPELALSLRALADKIAVEPEPFTGKTVTPERVSYVVLRGDTGELLAQGDIVPGRPALAYAPVDAAAETRLIRLREDKDPITGGPGVRGESDAERIDWNLPIAVGSTLKPIVARAAEEAFPQLVSAMSLTAAGHARGCRSHRGIVVDPMLGHCPPTSLAGTPTTADLHEFLAHSPNWYQAALGLIGLGLPSGRFEVGGQTKTLADITGTDLASWPTETPLLVHDQGGPIVRDSDVVIAGVRRTPMWGRIEALLGRPLCTLGDRKSCERAAERADVCAARALPIASPDRDLRYLVSLGPSSFEFYGDDRPNQDVVPVREYFQLLRGSGVHSIGSLAQLTDAFGRVVYDPGSGALQLAASWFPSSKVGTTPAWTCRSSAGRDPSVLGADGGLCAVVGEGGTAHAPFQALLSDTSIAIYGAKTGTIDSLAEIARHPEACASWNRHHTDPTKPLDRAHQASWLDCGKTPPDDSLFVVAFGVVTKQGTIPVTLGIQLQRGGKSAAARSAPHWITAIASYLRGS